MAGLDAAALQKFTETTTFTADEIKNMHENFSKLSSGRTNGHIDRVKFGEMMGNGDAAFLDGLFRVFDRDGSGGIDFSEFVSSLAIYHGKAKDMPSAEKQKIFFKIYDADGDDEISQDDLYKMLRSCFASSFMSVPEEDLKELVQETFKKYELTPKGTINFQSYSKHAFSHRSGYM
jgi:serine/threonine-protein phosphatase 2B regulatory subunit